LAIAHEATMSREGSGVLKERSKKTQTVCMWNQVNGFPANPTRNPVRGDYSKMRRLEVFEGPTRGVSRKDDSPDVCKKIIVKKRRGTQ